MQPFKLSSRVWQLLRGDVIIDADGWRDGTCDFVKDHITEAEYERRLAQCTVSLKGKL